MPKSAPALDQKNPHQKHPWSAKHTADQSIIEAYAEGSKTTDAIASVMGTNHAPIANLIVHTINHQVQIRQTINTLTTTLELCLACDRELSLEAEQNAKIENHAETVSPNAILTQREIELLTLAAQGKTRGQIAKLLSIKSDTVKKHFNKILRTLNASNKTHAVSIATALGAITLYLEDVQNISGDDDALQKGATTEEVFTQMGNISTKT